MRGERSKWAFVLLIAAMLAAGLLVACGSGGTDEGSNQFLDQIQAQIKSPRLAFGEEGSEDEREEAARAVKAYFTARGDDDWPKACAQLARPMLAKIGHLATSATDLEDKSCPSFLGTYTRLSAKEGRDGKVVDAGSLRVQGQRGFLIYYGAGKVVYAMPLNREDDAWKLASLTAESLG